jgi:hypothetical protein
MPSHAVGTVLSVACVDCQGSLLLLYCTALSAVDGDHIGPQSWAGWLAVTFMSATVQGSFISSVIVTIVLTAYQPISSKQAYRSAVQGSVRLQDCHTLHVARSPSASTSGLPLGGAQQTGRL